MSNKITCPNCHGEKVREITKWEESVGEYDVEVICNECDGTGYVSPCDDEEEDETFFPHEESIIHEMLNP